MDPIYIQGSKKTCLNLETIIEELLEVVKNIDEWMMNYKFWKNNKNYLCIRSRSPGVPSSHLLFVHWLR